MPVTLSHKKKQKRPDGSVYWVEVETQYTTVAERVSALHESRNGETVSIETGIVSEDDAHVTMWAKVIVPAGSFWGHARSDKMAGNIEGQSPLEVAETSAVGRALGFAGFGIVEGIASADEIKAAGRGPSKHTAATEQDLLAYMKEANLTYKDVLVRLNADMDDITTVERAR